MSASSIAMLRWLNAAGVDYVLVGPVARAVRGDSVVRGPVAIVPAPYGRNLERLTRLLNGVQPRERSHAALLGIGAPESGRGGGLRFTEDQLLRPSRWTLTCGTHDLDIEGRPVGSPSFQELLYEAVRIELAEGVSAEVASPEDIEHYDHVRRTGMAPELVVTRATAV